MIVCTKRFFGVIDGTITPRWIEAGETVTGDLAREAVIAGWAAEPKRKALKGAPENK